MKKLLLILSLVLLGATGYAKTFKVVEGSAAVLKDGGDVVLKFDFDGATWDNKMPIVEHYANLEELIPRCYEEFPSFFDRILKKSNVVKKAEDAVYELSFKITNMDSYFRMGHVTKVWGKVTVTEVATGNLVCVIDIDEFEGISDFSVDDSFGKCFRFLGGKIAEIMKKGKA